MKGSYANYDELREFYAQCYEMAGEYSIKASKYSGWLGRFIFPGFMELYDDSAVEMAFEGRRMELALLKLEEMDRAAKKSESKLQEACIKILNRVDVLTYKH